MSLLQGDPLPNITTTKDISTTGPDWYTQYLQDLAKPGQALMGQTGQQLVAPMSTLQQKALDLAPTALTGYTDLMRKAGLTAEEAAKGITPEMIGTYMSPYMTQFTDASGTTRPGLLQEMERLQQQNLQRNLLPTLRGAFAGTGGMGSQRMMGALGQMGADVQANLLGQQTSALQQAYGKALDTAAQQAGLTRQGALAQQSIASADLDAATKALEEAYGLGSKEQQFRQSQILAPVAAAKSAADVYANLKVPSMVSEKAVGPIPGAYSTSPLAQIAGLGSLFAAGSGGTSAASGFFDLLTKAGNWLGGLGGGGGAAPDPGPGGGG